MALRGVLFDLDDTLVDWRTAIDRAAAGALERVDLGGDALAFRSFWEEVRGYTWRVRDGRVVDREHWRLRFEPQVPWERAFPDWSRSRRAAAVQHFRDHLDPRLFEDAAPVLLALRGLRLGVLSNNPAAKVTLGKLGLAAHFACVVSADDPFRKPHAAAFAVACEALALPAGEVAYAGDSIRADVDGALAAGLGRVFWLDRFGDAYDLGPRVTRIETLAEIDRLLAIEEPSR